jgi:hypothetical protein
VANPPPRCECEAVMHFSSGGGQRQRLSVVKAVGFCVGNPTRCTQQREQGFHRRPSAGSGSSRDRTILSRSRVCDYWAAKPYGPANYGRVVGVGCRARIAVVRDGCEDADCSASATGGAYGRHWGLLGCVDVDAPHVVVLVAVNLSPMPLILWRCAEPAARGRVDPTREESTDRERPGAR